MIDLDLKIKIMYGISKFLIRSLYYLAIKVILKSEQSRFRPLAADGKHGKGATQKPCFFLS